MGHGGEGEEEEGRGGGDNLFRRGINYSGIIYPGDNYFGIIYPGDNYSGIDYPGDNLFRGIIYFVTPVVKLDLPS